MRTTTEQNKAVIRRFFDAWNSRQPDAFDDLIAPDVVRHCEATPGVEVRNLDQVKEFLRQDTAVFPDSVQTIKLLVAEENLAAAWTTMRARSRDKWAHFHLRVARRNLISGQCSASKAERSQSGG
jgi:ketosteroid isomerase-like protein